MKLIQKAVIKRKDKFLILLRSKDVKFFPEHWDFPGGKLEKGEKPFKGIEREVLEETSLKIKAMGVVGVYEMTLKNIPRRFTIYSAKIISGRVKISHEHLEFRWATKEEILKLKVEPFITLYFEEHP